MWAAWLQEIENDLDLSAGVYLEKPKSEGLTPLTSGKYPRDLTKEEIKSFNEPVSKAKFKEPCGLYDLGCFERQPRDKCHNIIDSRCVTTWKIVDGLIGIKCRLTARGFKDKMQELETYAGTSS